jgi:arginyl-tRNA synthetase
MKEALVTAIHAAASLPIEVIGKNLVSTKDIKHGDLAFPCFLLAKEWGKSPPECAKKLQEDIVLPDGFAKAEVQGPYVNFFFDRTGVIKTVTREVLEKGEGYGGGSKSSNIVIDFSAPNISKPFHIGHLRTTIIGLALKNVFAHLGHNVTGVNHLGDWGTQFGFVYAGCKIWGKPEGEMTALVGRYVDANLLRKAQDAGQELDKPNVNEIARDYFKRLEAGDSEAREFWQWNLDASLAYYKKTYERMNVTFESWNGESFYFQFFDEYSKILQDSGILENSRGALGVDLGEPLGFARLLTEDGRTLYLTRDVITADYREKTYSPERIVYVVGAPQTLHFKQLQAILRKLKHPAAGKIVHIPYGHVPGISTRKMKGEAGDISLDALLEDAHDRARAAYESEVSRRPEGVDVEQVAESVGLGAVYFNYLCRTNNKEFHFNWDEALNFKGDTGPYLMYAVARLHGIEDKARAEGIHPLSQANGELLTEDEAWELVTLLSRFAGVVERTAQDYEPCHICNYALDLAKAISRAYLTLRVVGEERIEKAQARLTLFITARTVLRSALKLLGIRALERM